MSPMEALVRSLAAEHRVLVCGGREFSDRARAFDALDALIPVPSLIIHGAARGADRIASSWASARDIPQLSMPADWDRYGRAAGYRRNAEMLAVGCPHRVVAFPGGPGTKMMISLAASAGVEVVFA